MSRAETPKNIEARPADEPTHLAEPDRREIVAEAAMTFGEAAAGELAAHLGLSLADCAAEIGRFRQHSL